MAVKGIEKHPSISTITHKPHHHPVHHHPKPPKHSHSPRASKSLARRARSENTHHERRVQHTPSLQKTDLEMIRRSSDAKMIDLIIRYGNNAEGLPALHAAVKNLDHEAVRLFLEHGADANTRIDYLLPFVPMRALDYAAISGDVQMIQLLIDHGAEVNPGPRPFLNLPADILEQLKNIDYSWFDESVNPFYSFSYSTSTPYSSSFPYSTETDWDEIPDQIEAFFTNLPTPMHFAVLHNQKEAVIALLKNGADPNQSAIAGGGSCFQLAMILRPELFELMLEHSQLPIENETSYILPLAVIHTAVQQGAPIEVLECIIARGGDLEATTFAEKRTPIYLAPNGEILQFLIDHGANVHVRDDNGFTPLHYYVDKSFLGGWGGWMGEPSEDLPQPGMDKVCQYIDILLNAGVDINAKTLDGRGVLDLTWNQQVKDFLISRGAVAE